MSLGNHLKSGDCITLYELVCTLRKPHAYGYTTDLWERNGLPVKKVKVINKRYKMIDIDDFWRWGEKHKNLLDFSGFEKNSLGLEPAWVEEKRQADYKKFQNGGKRPWTQAEDDKLRYLLTLFRYTYDELSKELQRSEAAIKRRIYDLNLKERPVRKKAEFWTEDQTRLLSEMYNRGWSFEEISKKIGKTALACRGKYETMTIRPNYSSEYYRKHKALAYVTYLLKIHFNALNFDGYWQKEMCMNWDDVKGCKAGEKNCDECVSFQKIQVQYCVRCGKDFFERKKSKICSACRAARKKQAQRKYAVLNGACGKERYRDDGKI